MPYGDPNPSYNPESLGLDTIAEVDYSDGNYVYDTRIVWKSYHDGLFYTARDSGCSCPTPFENYNTIESLDRLDFATLEEEVRHEKRMIARYVGSYGRNDYVSDEELDRFLATVKNAMNQPVIWRPNR